MRKLTFGIVGFGIVIASSQACQEKYGDDCSRTGTCPPGDGDGDGDTGGTGGTGDGDGDLGGGGGDGTGGTGTGGTPITTCEDLSCEGDTPHCDEDEVECVECLENPHCTEPTASLCDAGECTACSEHADCAHLEDTLVCDEAAGACVECNDMSDCGGNVCAPETHTCTNIPARTEFACEECAYDEQCAEGHVCVEMSYDDPTQGVVGTFCLWERDAGPPLPGPNGACGLNSRPYAQQASVTTVDGAPATVCSPRTSTCPAILQHATEVTGCETPVTDDAACGAEGFNDGRCRNNSSLEARCSYPCLGNEDCQSGSTCPPAGDRYCSL